MKISTNRLKQIIKEEIENLEISELDEQEEVPGEEPAAAEKHQSDVEKIKMLIPRINTRVEMQELLTVALSHIAVSKDGLTAMRNVLGSAIAGALVKKLGTKV
tara:strand:+ start:103 stop:411 length:309 start_codon:yes stop_codon:yes gene_type:complete